jgi:hypothetical protein
MSKDRANLPNFYKPLFYMGNYASRRYAPIAAMDRHGDPAPPTGKILPGERPPLDNRREYSSRAVVKARKGQGG